MTRSQNSLVADILEYLKENNGKASTVELCSQVLGLKNCNSLMADNLIRSGLPADGRLRLDSQGIVRIVVPKKNDPFISRLKYAVMDIEALSLAQPHNRITEIAIVKVDGKEISGSYSTLINPRKKIPPYVRNITGITDEMVKDAPEFNLVAPEIIKEIGNRVIVAHNASFDVNILNFELGRTRNLTLPNGALCTVKLSRKLQPGLAKYQLGKVAEFFNIEINDRHRAMGDAEATAKILLNLLDLAEEQGIHTWSQLWKIGGYQKPAESDKSK